MPKIYGVSKSGRIHREEQTPHDPDNPKPSRYVKPKKAVKKVANKPVTSKKVMVVDSHMGTARIYASIKEAAAAIGCAHSMVGERINGRTCGMIHGRYCVTVPPED